MSDREEYAEGFHEGRRWAEVDIRNGSGFTTLYNDGVPALDEGGGAYELGIRRGYRDTFARYEAGTLTWEMFEQAPLGTDLKSEIKERRDE